MPSFWITEYTAEEMFGTDYQAFTLFDGTHIFWLCFAAVFCTAVSIFYRKSSEKTRRKIRIAMSSAIIAVEAARIILTLATGQWRAASLPLHLCSVNIFVCLWYTIRPNKMAGNILYSLCMTGAAVAQLSPSWCAIPIANFFHIDSEVIHILLFTYPVMLLAGGFKPELKMLPKVIAAVLVMLVIIYPVNMVLGTNFFFVGDPYGNPITVLCTSFFGEKFFIVGYVLIACVLFTLLYSPFAVYAHFQEKAKTPA